MNKSIQNFEITFVILHYNVINETINCINSIQNNIDTENYHIVVVDNKSPNNSGQHLLNKYNGCTNITVILSEENVGFAKGNNLGIKYVYENYSTKYLCCLNNDTLLLEKNLLSKLENEYHRSWAFVIGPKIILKNGVVQNLVGELESLDTYKKMLNDSIRKLRYFKMKNIIKRIIRLFHLSFLLDKKKMNFETNNSSANLYHKNIILHGSCLFFTPKAIHDSFLFNDKTFLFREEELLFLYLKKHDFISVYQPNILIKHLEDVSTDSIVQSSAHKKYFLLKNQVKSLSILVNEMEKDI